MKASGNVLVAVLLSGLLVLWSNASEAAGAGKDAGKPRGGKATAHRSENGTLNTNSQWSADPERGWMRAEERHKMHDEKESGADRVKQNNGKAKGEGKPNKF